MLLSVFLCELGGTTFHRTVQAPDNAESVLSGAFFDIISEINFTHLYGVKNGERSMRMVKLNGEEKELAGKNLLEYLKAAGFKAGAGGRRAQS